MRPVIVTVIGSVIELRAKGLRTSEVLDSVPTGEGLLRWLLAQPDDRIERLLAYCVAASADALRASSSDVQALAVATQLDMRRWREATGENYFSRIPKTLIIRAIEEATGESVEKKTPALAKRELVAYAETAVRGRGWLPALLTVPPVDGAGG
jgi:hypothetical protein